MKNIKGWIALAIFITACLVIGLNRFLMKSLNMTVMAMILVSIALVSILNMKNKEEKGNE